MAIAYVSRPSKMTIAVTTPPTTTSYMQGDTFDPTGMVVTGTRRDGSTVDVTANCTFSPSLLETSGTQTITISYGGKTTTTSVTVSEVSISITTPPTKTEYEKGDTLDLTGIVVTAMDGQRTKNVTSECTFSPADGSRLNTAGSITITATYYGHTATTSIDVAGLVGISITTPPTKTAYREGDTLDLAGIVVTADYGTTTRDVTSQCTFSPADGSTLTSSSTTLTVTFLDQSTTMPLTIIASTLDATDWATIQAIGAAGTGSQYWSIGDTKSVYLNGNVGSYLTLNGTYKVFIIEFNYRSQKGIYFAFKNDYSSIAFVDSKYNTGSGGRFKDGSKTFNMNHWASGTNTYNYGGWKGCDLRYDILGSTDVAPSGYGSSDVPTDRQGYNPTSTCATNPVSNTLMAALPRALRAVMSPITVYSTDGGQSSSIQSSIDYLPLFSNYEIYISDGGSYVNSAEASYVSLMSYYAQSAENTKNLKHNQTTISSTNLAYYHLRSADKAGKTSFLCQQGKTYDRSGHYVAYQSLGIAPFFRVA